MTNTQIRQAVVSRSLKIHSALALKRPFHIQSWGALYHSSEGGRQQQIVSNVSADQITRGQDTPGTLVTTERVCCCQDCNGSLAASTHSDISPPFTTGLATNIYCSLWRQIVVVVGWAVSGPRTQCSSVPDDIDSWQPWPGWASLAHAARAQHYLLSSASSRLAPTCTCSAARPI